MLSANDTQPWGGIFGIKMDCPLSLGLSLHNRGDKKISGIYGEVVIMGGIYRREMLEKILIFSYCMNIRQKRK